jgi:hypothetical protein
MLKKLNRHLVECLLSFWQGTSQGDIVGSLYPLYRPANLYLLLRLYYAGTLHSKQKNPARNSKSSNVRNRPFSFSLVSGKKSAGTSLHPTTY